MNKKPTSKLAPGHSTFLMKYRIFAIVLDMTGTLDKIFCFAIIKSAKSPAPILHG
jgi:hypothetical protein